MTDNDDLIEQIGEIGKKTQGRRELLHHLKGGKNTATASIKAFCYECMGYYADGVQDCETSHCPLYPRNPYNPNRAKQKKPWVKGSKMPGVKKTAVKVSKVDKD